MKGFGVLRAHPSRSSRRQLAGASRYVPMTASGSVVLVAAAFCATFAVACGALASLNAGFAISLAALPLIVLGLPRLGSLLVPSERNQALFAALALLITAAPWTLSAVSASGFTDAHGSLSHIKLLVLGLGVGLALVGTRPVAMRSSTTTLLLAYACVALVGGALQGDMVSVERSVRYAVVVAAAAALAGRLTRRDLSRLVIVSGAAISLTSIAGAAVGAAQPYQGRLQGYPIPLHPNLLGFVSALALIFAASLWSERAVSTGWLAAAAACLAPALVLSGSRTSIAALLVGLLGLQLRARRGRPRVIAGVVMGIVLGVTALQIATSIKPLSALSTRGGSTTLTGTLNTRTSEWEAATQANRTGTEKAFGQGLNAKTLAVNLSSAQYASVDGTWYAAYLSAGLIGVAILAIFLARILAIAFGRVDRLLLGVGLFVAVSSVLTNVLNDISVGLVILLALGTVGETLTSRAQEAPVSSTAAPVRL